MSESLGARLRQRREAQGIGLDTVASETKIKLSLLEALERDDVSHWPGGLFRRSFVRAYAQAIGLEPDSVVREFLATHFSTADETNPAFESQSNGNTAASGFRGAPPTRLHSIVDSAIQSLSGRRPSPAPQPRSAPVDPTPELRTPVPTSVSVPASFEPDLQAIADLCTALGRVECAEQLPPLLDDAARILNTRGLVVWLWDVLAAELRPALACGYPAKMLARLPAVTLDSDNATAATFRSGQTCTVDGDDNCTVALVVPLLTPAGCIGTLALEFEPNARHDPKKILSIRAMATILAAQLAQLLGEHTFATRRELPDTRSRESA